MIEQERIVALVLQNTQNNFGQFTYRQYKYTAPASVGRKNNPDDSCKTGHCQNDDKLDIAFSFT
jgi:hypothetical protein